MLSRSPLPTNNEQEEQELKVDLTARGITSSSLVRGAHRRSFATDSEMPRFRDTVTPVRRSRLLRLCATVLLGSIGAGLVSPALASGDLADRLWADGIAPEALDAAMVAAAESESPAGLAQAVTSALGESAPPPDVFLHALYGHLYQLLRAQQGLNAVASAAASQAGVPVWAARGVWAADLHAPNASAGCLSATQSETLRLPRFFFPAIQPLGP